MTEKPSIGSLLREHWHLARTLRELKIHFDPERCRGVWQCYEVCPVGQWTPDYENRVVQFSELNTCVACGACMLQCPKDAIQLTFT